MNKLKFSEDRVRIVLMANDVVGLGVTNFLVNRNENIVCVFVHNEENQKMSTEIIRASGVDYSDIYFASELKNSNTVDILREYKPDVIITCYWAHLLSPEIIRIPKYGCINFHPALLPLNRGWYPSVWPFIDGTKAGVTLHLIDEGADTGDVLAQYEMDIKETDTAGTVYERSKRLILAMFKQTWLRLYDQGIYPIKQDHAKATYHTKKEGNALNEIDMERSYKAKDLINLLRSRTFGDKTFAFYKKDNDIYQVKVVITKG